MLEILSVPPKPFCFEKVIIIGTFTILTYFQDKLEQIDFLSSKHRLKIFFMFLDTSSQLLQLYNTHPSLFHFVLSSLVQWKLLEAWILLVFFTIASLAFSRVSDKQVLNNLC